MILPFMTQAERRVARRKSLRDHIRLLEERYPESERYESVGLLKGLLSRIPGEKNGLQTESKIQTKI